VKAAKTIVIAGIAYAGIVVAFESAIGYFQPTRGDTIVITTVDEQGGAADRVVSRLESSGQLYVAANHWPRAWYRRALENPDVEIEQGGVRTPRLAVPVSGEEHDRVDRDNALPLPFRILTGFPPRYFLRLDPR
jgi:hypothetical protein